MDVNRAFFELIVGKRVPTYLRPPPTQTRGGYSFLVLLDSKPPDAQRAGGILLLAWWAFAAQFFDAMRAQMLKAPAYFLAQRSVMPTIDCSDVRGYVEDAENNIGFVRPTTDSNSGIRFDALFAICQGTNRRL